MLMNAAVISDATTVNVELDFMVCSGELRHMPARTELWAGPPTDYPQDRKSGVRLRKIPNGPPSYRADPAIRLSRYARSCRRRRSDDWRGSRCRPRGRRLRGRLGARWALGGAIDRYAYVLAGAARHRLAGARRHRSA